jgi:hypothetical protein
MPVVSVYRAANQVDAYSILAALRAEGVAAELHEFHNPWEISWLEGRPWGEIVVLAEDAQRALEIIGDYVKSVSERSVSDNSVHEDSASQER